MSTGQDFFVLSSPISYLRPGGRQDRTPGPPVLCSALVETLLKSCLIVEEHLENMQRSSFWVTTKIRENLFSPRRFTRKS